MTIFEKLKQGMLEEIIVKACDFLINDCDTCPKFISSRCKESCNEMRLRRLRTEAKIMANLEKLKQDLCNEIGGCDKCPPSISKHCNEVIKAVEDWKKPQEPKDSPSGWVKLKTTQSAIYINTSKIVALAPMMRPDGAAAPAKAITKIHTVGAEDNPWMVDESIDEVVKKIERA